MPAWPPYSFISKPDIIYLLPPPSSDFDILKYIIPGIGVVVSVISIGWSAYNSHRTKQLQLAISNNQFKQKIFEKFTFDPIYAVLREYYSLIGNIEDSFNKTNKSDRIKAIKLIQQTELSNITIKLEREIMAADKCSIISRNDMCGIVIDLHSNIYDGFNAMVNDVLKATELESAKERTINAINILITEVMEMLIAVSQSLVNGKT